MECKEVWSERGQDTQTEAGSSDAVGQSDITDKCDSQHSATKLNSDEQQVTTNIS
jgi:hypothetical protein